VHRERNTALALVVLCLAAGLLCLLSACSAAASPTAQPVAASPVPPAPTAPPTAPPPTPCPSPTPALLLTGGDSLDWDCGVPFEDPGYQLFEEGEVDVIGNVVCWNVGEYTLHYTLSRDGEILAQADRTVHVCPVSLPDTVPTEKVIYLTFDDGPCEYTARVLDTLAAYDAKATFFIVGSQTPYLDMLPRIQEEGHSIGIHCYSHNYELLYRSTESFFEDFMAARQIVYEKTGTYAQLSRFPGSSRTASYVAKRLEGGYAQLEEMLHNMGVRCYDWNVQPETIENGAEGTYLNFINTVGRFDVPITLQHDTRLYSVAALESMLQWGTENGYSFRSLDCTVPEVHFYTSG